MRLLLFFLFSWLLLGCRADELQPKGFAEFVRAEENGFVANVESGLLQFRVQYEPPEFVALRESVLNADEQVPFDSSLADAARFLNFEMSLKPVSNRPIDDVFKEILGSPDSLEAVKQRFFYNAQHFFSLKIGETELPCAFYHVQLSGKLDNSYRVFLAFENAETRPKKWDQDLVFKFQDDLWTHQTHTLAFKKENLNSLPKLIFNK